MKNPTDTVAQRAHIDIQTISNCTATSTDTNKDEIGIEMLKKRRVAQDEGKEERQEIEPVKNEKREEITREKRSKTEKQQTNVR